VINDVPTSVREQELEELLLRIGARFTRVELRLPRMSSALVGRLHPGWRWSASSLESVLSRSWQSTRHDDRPCCCDCASADKTSTQVRA
jgi:hypothetical protein